MNPASAVATLKTAHGGLCAGLSAGIGRALSVSRKPKTGFVDRQIAIHQEYQARQQSKVTISNKLQTALDRLQAIAQSKHWSQRELAGRIGIPESTLRKVKRGLAQLENHIPKLEAAVQRLTPS